MMLVQQFPHISVFIPHHLAENIVVEITENPSVGFRLRKGAENAGRLTPVEIAERLRRHIRNAADGYPVFGGISPEIRLAIEFFLPVAQQPFIFFLLGFAFVPRTRNRQHDDHVVRQTERGNPAVLTVCHRCDVSRNPCVLHALCNAGHEFPDIVGGFLRIIPRRGPFEMRQALRAAAEVTTVIGHDAENFPHGVKVAEMLVPGDFPIAPQHPFPILRTVGQNSFGIQENRLEQAFGTETDLPCGIVRMRIVRTILAHSLRVKREVFGMRLRKTLFQAERHQPVAIRDIARLHAVAHLRQSIPFHRFRNILIPDDTLRPAADAGQIDRKHSPVLKIGTLHKINLYRQFPLLHARRDGAGLAGEIEPHSGKTLQKIINGKQSRALRPGGNALRRIAADNQDIVPDAPDEKSVAVKFRYIHSVFERKSGIPDNQRRLLPAFLIQYLQLTAENLSQMLRQLLRREFCGGRRIARDDDLKLRHTVRKQDSHFRCGDASAFRNRIRRKTSGEPAERQKHRRQNKQQRFHISSISFQL